MPIVLRAGELSFELTAGKTYVIGSSPDADLRIAHGSVSRTHAELELHGLEVRVRDLGSTNGTFCGDARIETGTVRLGSTLRLGEIELHLEQFVPAAAQHVAAVPVQQRYEDPGFHELMAEQLRRAPWFAISIVAHVVLILLLQLLWQHDPDAEDRNVFMSLQPEEQDGEEIEEDVSQEEEIEVEEVQEELVLQDALDDTTFEEPESEAAADAGALFDPDWGAEGMLTQIRDGTGDDVLKEMSSAAATESFRKTVSGLRQSGLDIVFVFDSTHSMDKVLSETKQRIALMVDVLHALVRNARIGIVTYRDHGKFEEYVTRHIPLAADYYRSINFMQTVSASGGGDIPEAVDEALRLAIRQKWRKNSRRIVVLIGDAPSHEKTRKQIQRTVKSFAKTDRAVVHAIMTKQNDGTIDPETRRDYQAIAKAGGGSCISLENERAILNDILALAIGTKFRRDLDNVYKVVERKRSNIEKSAKRIVDDADLDAIREALTQTRPDDDVVLALTHSRNAAIARELIKMLRTSSTPQRTRQAVSYVLQRMLLLSAPPIDAESGKTLAPADARRLERRVERDLG